MIDVHSAICNLIFLLHSAGNVLCVVNVSFYRQGREFGTSSFDRSGAFVKKRCSCIIDQEKETDRGFRFWFYFFVNRTRIIIIITNGLALEFGIDNDRKALIYRAILASCNYPFPKSQLYSYPISELNSFEAKMSKQNTKLKIVKQIYAYLSFALCFRWWYFKWYQSKFLSLCFFFFISISSNAIIIQRKIYAKTKRVPKTLLVCL